MKAPHLLLAAGAFLACGPPPRTPPKIRTTYRLLAGVSMGGFGASVLGMRHPELFDGIAALGGPFDAAYLVRYMEHYHLGGFCTREQIEDLLAQNPGRPEVLNDPKAVGACMQRRPSEVRYEHSQAYWHWRFTTNGGTFDRSAYLNLFSDLALALGNPLYFNPASPVAPPGVDPALLRDPPADLCTRPVVVPRFYNAEYNPDGRYDAVTFCDGEEDPIFVCEASHRAVDFCAEGPRVVPRSEEPAFAQRFCGTERVIAADKATEVAIYRAEKGRYDPCREHTRNMPLALAIDFNRNGRRDYGEPLAINSRERFNDTGADGCANPLEDGTGGCVSDPATSPYAAGTPDPNADDYDAQVRPDGTEQNWLRDDGEAFRDDGLDGVPATGDHGEGNGTWDQSPNRRRFLEHDPRTNWRKMSAEAKSRLDVYADGGIRDVFNFGVSAGQFFGAVRAALPDQSTLYRSYARYAPATWDEVTFDGIRVRWSQMPRNAALMYGAENPTDNELLRGEGDHVGTARQATQRFFILTSWASARWPSRVDPPIGTVTDSGNRIFSKTFFSKALGAQRDYGIFLPPGYDDPANAQAGYPVMYMLHGYGQRPSGPDGFVLVAGIMFDPYMQDPSYRLRKYIVVYASGRCCFTHTTGARACTELDPDGNAYEGLPGWTRECHAGTFYVDRAGLAPGDQTPYEQSFLDLVEHVDATYRTLPPTDVEKR